MSTTIFGYPVTVTTLLTLDVDGEQVTVPATTRAKVVPNGAVVSHASRYASAERLPPPFAPAYDSVPVIQSESILNLDALLDAIRRSQERGGAICSPGTLDALRREEGARLKRRRAAADAADRKAYALESEARGHRESAKRLRSN